MISTGAAILTVSGLGAHVEAAASPASAGGGRHIPKLDTLPSAPLPLCSPTDSTSPTSPTLALPGAAGATSRHGPNQEPTPEPSPPTSPAAVERPDLQVNTGHDEDKTGHDAGVDDSESSPHLWMPRARGLADRWLHRHPSEEVSPIGWNSAVGGSSSPFPHNRHATSGAGTGAGEGEGAGATASPAPSHTTLPRQKGPHRRMSSLVGISWEQEEAVRAAIPECERPHYRGAGAEHWQPYDELESDPELDAVELSLPQDDALWLTTTSRPSTRSSLPFPPSQHPIGGWSPIGTGNHPDISMAAVPENGILVSQQYSHSTSHHHRQQHQLRHEEEQRLKDEPLYGTDIEFPRCSSPEMTKIESDHLFSRVCELERTDRDVTGNTGLWMGYCSRPGGQETGEDGKHEDDVRRPKMLSTPAPRRFPNRNPFDDLAALGGCRTLSSGTSGSGSGSAGLGSAESTPPESRRGSLVKRSAAELELDRQKRQLRAVARREAVAAAIVESKIRAEFDHTFVSQVYNYLSLGYPPAARAFDEELSRITGASMAELREQDEVLMAEGGHFVDDDQDEHNDHDKTKRAGARDGTKTEKSNQREKEEENKEWNHCPRWRALQTYVAEWARQHPNLDCLDPMVWGLQERKGSWGA